MQSWKHASYGSQGVRQQQILVSVQEAHDTALGNHTQYAMHVLSTNDRDAMHSLIRKELQHLTRDGRIDLQIVRRI